ncbi:MAG: molybdopterin molybdotransferase MoeA [Candidatus Neomarinimicrobiota bacterium]
MIDINKARQIVMMNLPETRVESRDLLASQGLNLAEDVRSAEQMPGFSNSAMDGFAIAIPTGVTAIETKDQIPVIGESRAGKPFNKVLDPGTAVAISTGAMIPEGTDRIIPVEHCTKLGQKIQINHVGKPGSHIRFKGEEVKADEVIAHKFQMLTPPLLSFLGSFGVTIVKVFAPPRISILTTGEELVPLGQILDKGQIRDTNSIFIQALLHEMNITPVMLEHIADDLNATESTIRKAADLSDIIIICGGVSVGKHDHVKSAAEKLGFERRLWKVAQKPGKPFYFASKNGVSLFGLPGNPGSVAATSVVYLYPAIRSLLGHSESNQPIVRGRFGNGLNNLKPGRAKIHIVKINSISAGIATIETVENQKSHMLSGPVNGDGFVIIPEDVKIIETKKTFRVVLFPWFSKGKL